MSFSLKKSLSPSIVRGLVNLTGWVLSPFFARYTVGYPETLNTWRSQSFAVASRAAMTTDLFSGSAWTIFPNSSIVGLNFLQWPHHGA